MSENAWRLKWSHDQVKAILLEQFDSFWNYDLGIVRTQLSKLEQTTSLPHAVIISGLRRVGKSTLLAQLAHRLKKEKFYYINFEDERFIDFSVQDFNYLYQVLVELFGERRLFIIDEIQNIPGWEHFVRRFMDQSFKFFITGSNASLLSHELGSRLTGRYIPIELFPFSFKEYLQFCNRPIPQIGRMTTVDIANLRKSLHDYIQFGGIPDALKYPEMPLLDTLYNDVIYRDIAARYGIEQVSVIRELAFYLLSNPASLISYNKLKARFHVGSVNTIKKYINYLENSWLFFILNIYDFSIKRQQIAPKKVYGIDLGLINSVGFQFSPNTGKMLENLVFLALRRKSDNIYYYTSPENYEIDFYMPARRLFIQVTQHLSDTRIKDREIRAITAASQYLDIEQALLLADDNAERSVVGGIPVETRSIAEWLLENSE
jgi:uncharacterized protein